MLTLRSPKEEGSGNPKFIREVSKDWLRIGQYKIRTQVLLNYLFSSETHQPLDGYFQIKSKRVDK